jgi:hypothetical protein
LRIGFGKNPGNLPGYKGTYVLRTCRLTATLATQIDLLEGQVSAVDIEQT